MRAPTQNFRPVPAPVPTVMTPHPNPGYRGGQLKFYQDKTTETLVVNGVRKELTTNESKCVVVDGLVVYTKPVNASKLDPNRMFGFARMQLNPGEYIGVTGFDEMAPQIANLIDGKVYSLVGKFNRRPGNQIFLQAEGFVQIEAVPELASAQIEDGMGAEDDAPFDA